MQLLLVSNLCICLGACSSIEKGDDAQQPKRARGEYAVELCMSMRLFVT